MKSESSSLMIRSLKMKKKKSLVVGVRKNWTNHTSRLHELLLAFSYRMNCG